MRKIREIRKKHLVILFSVVTTLMFAVICVLGYALFKATRMNMYSKNIVLANNYFMNDYNNFGGDNVFAEYEAVSNEYADAVISYEDYHSVLRQMVFRRIYELENANDQKSAIETYEMLDDWYAVNSYSESVNIFYQALLEMFAKEGISPDVFSELAETAVNKDVFTAAELAMDINAADDYHVSMLENIFKFGKKIDVPYISQIGILPNGCEAVSAAMLLKYNGYDIDPVEFADKYLDKGEVYIKLGCRYGPNPKLKYAGDPKDEKGGWGCFAPVICKALNKYLGGKAFAKNLTGLTLSEIMQIYIKNDIPVAFWCTRDMEEIDKFYQWQSYDKSETFLYPVHEHCVVLTGYDEKYCYFNDPISEDEKVKYERSVVEESYISLGCQAVAIIDAKSSDNKESLNKSTN